MIVRPYRDADEAGGAERGLTTVQAWTRDDAATPPTPDGLRPVKVFAHSTGDERDGMRARFERVHDDVLYEKRLGL